MLNLKEKSHFEKCFFSGKKYSNIGLLTTIKSLRSINELPIEATTGNEQIESARNSLIINSNKNEQEVNKGQQRSL